jgi:hypothetical protein
MRTVILIALSREACRPGSGDFRNGLFQGLGDPPSGIMSFHLPEVAVIANVISNSIVLDVRPDLIASGTLGGQIECFQYRAGILESTSQVIYLATTRIPRKLKHELGDILGMDVIADLFAFVAIYLVFLGRYIAANQVTQESVQFNA